MRHGCGHGHYLLNPDLALKVGEEWLNIYDLLSLDKLAVQHRKREPWWRIDQNQRSAKILEHNKNLIKTQISDIQKNKFHN